MGYDLHITRKEYWSDEDGPTISLAEWLTFVANDPDIEPDLENAESENFVIVSHPKRWPLWWDPTGEIFTKNPDSAVVAKLVQIAQLLDARVLGDDEEIYGVDVSDPTICQRR